MDLQVPPLLFSLHTSISLLLFEKHNSHSWVAIVQLCGAVMSPDPEDEIFSGWEETMRTNFLLCRLLLQRDVHKSVLI